MKLEDTSKSLHDFGEWIFGRLKEFAGETRADEGVPVCNKGGWYRAPPRGNVCMYLFFVGPRGKKNRPNSVLLTTLWDDEFTKYSWVKQGNNWFGKPSADFNVQPGEPQAKERVVSFIRQSFHVVAVDLYSEEKQDIEARREFAEKVSQITEDTPEAQVAAKWINKKLGEVGKVTALAVRDILVNIASEVVKKTLLGG